MTVHGSGVDRIGYIDYMTTVHGSGLDRGFVIQII